MEENVIYKLVNLDKVVHQPARFGILLALRALRKERNPGWFPESSLGRATGLTQGNQATHLRVLQDAGLVEARKERVMNTGWTYTLWRITTRGREAVEEHWHRLKELREEMEAWEPPEDEREAGRQFRVLLARESQRKKVD